MEVSKKDQVDLNDHIITTIEKGATLGEMAWLNAAPRSATIRALTEVKLLKISAQNIQKLADTEAGFYKLFQHLSQNLSQHLRYTDEFAVLALENEIRGNKMRIALSYFMLNIFVVLCLYSFLLALLSEQVKAISTSSFITVLFLSFLLIFFYLIKISSHLPLHTFGLTLKNWRQAISEALFYTLIIMILITLIKWMMIRILPSYADVQLFEPYKSLHLKYTHFEPKLLWLMSVMLYCFIVVPFQEILARGGIQAPLMAFLEGKHKTLVANITANLIFSTMHLYISIKFALLVFIPGLYFGWLFGRHKTLLGPLVAHIMLGVYAVLILGI